MRKFHDDILKGLVVSNLAPQYLKVKTSNYERLEAFVYYYRILADTDQWRNIADENLWRSLLVDKKVFILTKNAQDKKRSVNGTMANLLRPIYGNTAVIEILETALIDEETTACTINRIAFSIGLILYNQNRANFKFLQFPLMPSYGLSSHN